MADEPDERYNARAALAKARLQLREILSQEVEVTQVSEELRYITDRNRFGERIAQSMQRKARPS